MTTTEQTAYTSTDSSDAGATRLLAQLGRRIDYDALPEDVIERAKQCVLDWFGVALAGADEPLTRILRDEVAEQGGHPQATLVGSGERVATLQAALVNGSASHALDYDDVNQMMSGHPTVPVLPAVLALGEQRRVTGRDLIAAFVAGFETECRAGQLVLPGHYQVGWHATATLGALGAAAASAHLLGLDEGRWRMALGIAATSAGGMKSMFGTMCKPFHAGTAAANGLRAATLAQRGFTSNPDVIETAQGFAATHTTTFQPERAAEWSEGEYALRDVLFKYHAACFGTHATIEGVLRLKEREGLTPEVVESITLRVPPGNLNMCNIQEPVTALEGKFSLRFTAALALGHGDATEQAFTDARVREPALVRLRDRVSVAPAGIGEFGTEVTIRHTDGRTLSESVNMNVPEYDLERQWSRLEAKFRSLAPAVLGDARAEELLLAVRSLERLDDVGRLLALATVREGRA